MKSMHNHETDLLFEAILSLQSVDDCYLFFEDICTIKELQAITQRFQVACQLDAERNYLEVSEDTGASSATISRVKRSLAYGSDGYAEVLRRLDEKGLAPWSEDNE